MKKVLKKSFLHKFFLPILGITFSCLFFSGCTSSPPETEYVEVSKFKILEAKLLVLEEEKSRFEEMFSVLSQKTEEQKTDEKDKDSKFDFFDQKITELSAELEKVKSELSEDVKLRTQQFTELEKIITELTDVKNFYLKTQGKNFEETSDFHSSSEGENMKKEETTSFLEKRKKIEIDTTEKSPQENEEKISSFKENSITELSLMYSSTNEVNGKTLLVFKKCNEEGKMCKNYVINKNILEKDILLPTEKGVFYLISGKIKSLGIVAEEEYFTVYENVILKK